MSNERKHEFELEIGAAPAEVWKALTEAEGIERWFAPHAGVTPGPDGTVTLSWGPGIEGTAPIHLWEEGKRFGWTEGEAKRVEFEIEPAGGAGGERTRLRMVQSGFGADAKFDDEFDSTQGGWQIFLAMLRYAAETWSGVAVTRHVHHSHFATLDTGEAWARLARAVGIAGASLNEGAACAGVICGRPFAGKVQRHPKPGYLLITSPAAMVALFSEKGGPGKALVTVQWVMAGGESADDAARFKSALVEWVQKVVEAGD